MYEKGKNGGASNNNNNNKPKNNNNDKNNNDNDNNKSKNNNNKNINIYEQDYDDMYDNNTKNNNNKKNTEQDSEEENSQLNGSLELVECPSGCGRRFKESVVGKHAKICKKVFQQKRKQFNTQQQRIVDDTQVQSLNQISKKQPKDTAKDAKKPADKKSKWKQDSEKFQAIMKQAKGQATQQDLDLL